MREMKTFKAISLIERFKKVCKSYGWKTSESEDWIAVGDEFHSFLITRCIHPSSFRAIVANRKCIVREGPTYRVVDAAYSAWLFSESPQLEIYQVIFEKPELSKKVAIYNLSPLFEGEKLCIKLNRTDSLVFEEFERFIKREFKVRLRGYSINRHKPESVTATVK
ncbi:MAG: hypothetical protein QXR17_01575 [Candidatus Bathyarchaeia archaeon]|nr:hypothetical protein [Candidatus Bathyarchaeota archaeon]